MNLLGASSDNCNFISCLKEGVQLSGSSHLSFKALSQKTYYVVVSDERVSVHLVKLYDWLQLANVD